MKLRLLRENTVWGEEDTVTKQWTGGSGTLGLDDSPSSSTFKLDFYAGALDLFNSLKLLSMNYLLPFSYHFPFFHLLALFLSTYKNSRLKNIFPWSSLGLFFF